LKNYLREQKIIGEVRDKIINRIHKDNMAGYVDCITLISSILFPMKYVLSCEQLHKETLYNRVAQSVYDATGYLDGLEIVYMCYKELFAKYKDLENVVFLVDPPTYQQTPERIKAIGNFGIILTCCRLRKDCN
jgi:hypothetical protein